MATSVENILDGGNSQTGLVGQINALGGWTVCERIGNGIYLQDNAQFTVDTPEQQLFDIIAVTDEIREDPDNAGSAIIARYASVQNIAQLPLQCKHGFVTKISNSFAEEDDYYVKFKGNQDQDGEGVFEETVRPGLYDEFEETVMPHRIVRTTSTTDADGDKIFTFYVGPIFWDKREVGDQLITRTPALLIGRTQIQLVIVSRLNG